MIDANIEGDIRAFTRYKVHYVGQSTKQEIWDRLTGHDKLQNILSLEYPFTYGNLPTHEIAILAFTFEDNLSIDTIGNELLDSALSNLFLGKDLPDQRTIYLDAEKALINWMQPKYNDELFKNYPKSTDGLYKHKLNIINYTFTDPISLVCDKGEIRGGLSEWGGDIIRVRGNKNAQFIKFQPDE